ncbi:TlpA disulfide reductase family protein [Sphingomonas sp.]|uniref:TlpA family protein disulfide reductase n=1 Tax=Sphingomonas sp. TaxID=28214 RepID=UPI002BF47C45|nr:TlpA disulfide reductase family protein [Sphingomonas sp.]HWK36630.1 TlpA disulfide reductase family protein [Sphingomonas sp.]
MAQGNESANVAAGDEVPPPSPDEALASGPAAKPGSFDTSHRGEAAPDFAFQDPAGKSVTLAAYRGTPVLLNLWATWCAPCIKEMPSLDALAVREGAKLQVIALSQDLDAAKVAPFWAKGGYRAIKPSLDPKIAFSTGLGVNLPTTILYDAAGKEVWRVSGAAEWDGADAAKALAL